jgi:hypothetical protein
LALDGLSFGLGLPQRGQQQRSENGNDRDDDEQFDEGEARVVTMPGAVES